MWNLIRQDDSAGWAQALGVQRDGSLIQGGLVQATLPFWSRGYTAWPSPQTATCTGCRRRTARQAAARGSGTPWRRAVRRTDTGPGLSCRTGEHVKTVKMSRQEWKCKKLCRGLQQKAEFIMWASNAADGGGWWGGVNYPSRGTFHHRDLENVAELLWRWERQPPNSQCSIVSHFEACNSALPWNHNKLPNSIPEPNAVNATHSRLRKTEGVRGRKKVVHINYEHTQTYAGVPIITALTELFCSVYTSANIRWRPWKGRTSQTHCACEWSWLLSQSCVCVCARVRKNVCLLLCCTAATCLRKTMAALQVWFSDIPHYSHNKVSGKMHYAAAPCARQPVDMWGWWVSARLRMAHRPLKPQ